MHNHPFYLSSSLQYWHEKSQRHMEMAVAFLHHGMYEECFSFVGMAVEAMLRAFYIEINGQLVHAQPSYEILIKTLRSYGEVDLDTELFLYSILELASHYNSFITSPPTEECVRKLLLRIDKILHYLSVKIGDDPKWSYHRILT
ncbi:HEPN domain-containing protein [Paenibacillus tianmuensis]